MEVQVRYGLSPVITAVRYDTVSVFETKTGCDQGNSFYDLGYHCDIIVICFVYRLDVLLGNDKHMHRGVGIYVFESVYKIVFKDF